MRSVERRFIDATKKHPNYSSIVCFGIAVTGQKLTKEIISKWFTKLVDQNDYSSKERQELIRHFHGLTKL